MAKSKKRSKRKRKTKVDPAINSGGNVGKSFDIFGNPSMTLEERVELLESILEDGKADKLYQKLPEKHGEFWTRRDEQLLVERFIRGARVTDIATMMKRTPFAIFCRLMKHTHPSYGTRLLSEDNVYKVMNEIVRSKREECGALR